MAGAPSPLREGGGRGFLSLYDLNNMVKGVVESSFDDTYWVVGEFYEARQAQNGHFYGELIQKDDTGRNIIARARVNCWARQYNLLRFRFSSETGQEIKAGMKVLIEVRVTFHESYGYSLNMVDIDATYTLGDLERRRKEILQKLEEDGILHDNQTLPLPRLMNRVAVISAQTAAGYGDFCDQLINNDYGLKFSVKLFPAVMQGQYVEESVLAALEAIEEDYEQWDVVVIIRGGGATSDLSDFDSYPLAARVACMPLPVVVGIGHERDETVLDYVAHTRVKTPTAAAALLIEHQSNELACLEQFQSSITSMATQRLLQEKHLLQRLTVTIPLAFGNVRQRESHRHEMIEQRFRNVWGGLKEREQLKSKQMEQAVRVAWSTRKEREQHRLELLEQRLKGCDPDLLLRRGYSITMVGDKIVRNAADLHEGDVITTRLESGEILSKVLCRNK